MKLTLFEVLQYGPIVAQDEDSGLIITVNGSYFNAYSYAGDGVFYSTEWVRPLCDYVSTDNGLYGADLAKVMDVATKLLRDELLSSEDSE